MIMPMKKKIIVVGAGPGGLASAMLLSQKGFDVHVFESADRIGGRNLFNDEVPPR
jgi:phytoene desaturase